MNKIFVFILVYFYRPLNIFRCCEKTMQLLRDNQETLLTILEVLLCDPLYSWSVKTAQQNAPNVSLDTTAECKFDVTTKISIFYFSFSGSS